MKIGRLIMTTKTDEKYNRPLKLVDTIDYQLGSVVSKTITNKKTGTITLFAFDKGQGLSEHTAPYDAFAYIIDGTAKVTISGKSAIVNKSEMITLPANHPHAVKAQQRFKVLLIMIRS